MGLSAMRPRGNNAFGYATLTAMTIALFGASAFIASAIAAPPPPNENPKRDVQALQKLAAAAEAERKSGLIETPNAVSQAEITHNATFDNSLAPLVNLSLSTADAAAVRDASRAISKSDHDAARALRAGIADPTAAKLVDWLQLRRGEGTIAQYRTFLAENPLWPNRWLLIEKLEEKIFAAADHTLTRGHFASTKPESAAGHMALALARQAAGRTDEARAIASKTWRDGDIPADLENAMLERLGGLISPADHKWRLDRLLTADFRWSASRKKRSKVIARQIPRVSKTEQQKARARHAVFQRSKSARNLMAGLPSSADADWGVTFHRAQLLRRSKRKTDAAKLLLSAPTSTAELVNPDAWWRERLIGAYIALDDNNPKLAYALVRDAGELSENPAKEQAFTAGWLALRYLGDVKAALSHFEAMVAAADGPLSRAESNYWYGRALESDGQKSAAEDAYRRSAENFDTFHGQLSRQRLAGGKTLPIRIVAPAAPTQAQLSRFLDLDAAKAAVIADKAGLGRDITRPFLANLGAELESEAEVAMAAHLTRMLGDTQQSLRIGKRAIGRGMNMHYYAYPLHAFPDYKPLRSPPEPAFLLGIARQESEFNTEIVSGAGAKGILQVMTITAKHVCSDYAIKCTISRLKTDEAYNTMIASAYIADRMEEFRGSYVLGLAGYNAGPGRARQWIKRFGDPRDGRIDPIDWIERIPFKETRDYVAKVLSNIQIYRARLYEAENPLRLEQDLVRAKERTARGKTLVAPGALASR